MTHYIDTWADEQSTVGIMFSVRNYESDYLGNIYLDDVRIMGDPASAVQPASLEKIKAMYE